MASTYTLNRSKSYPWTVTVPQIGDDGTKQEWRFTAYFKRLEQDEITALYAQLQSEEGITNRAYVEQVLDRFDPITDSDGKVISALDELLGVFPVPTQIVAAHRASIDELFVKN